MSRIAALISLVVILISVDAVQAQLFRRGGLRARGFGNFAPQQRAPIFQNPRFIPQNNVRQQPLFNRNGQLLNNARQALGVDPDQRGVARSVLENLLKQNADRGGENSASLTKSTPAGASSSAANGRTGIRPILKSSGSRIPSSDQDESQKIQQATMIQPIRDDLYKETPKPTLPKGVYSILERPDSAKQESKSDKEDPILPELEPILELPDEPAVMDKSKTSLDLTAPPIQPVEEKPKSSILKIVDPVKKKGF